MIRVLQVTSKLFRGGAESFIMNVYRNVDRKTIQFDFLVFHSAHEYYEDEIRRLGGCVYHVPVMESANLLRRKRMINNFFDEHSDYAAVHGHMAALGDDYLCAAAMHGIERRFSHSHIADFEHTPRNVVKQVFQKRFGNHATLRLACSRAAGEFMYPGQDFIVINNGIDINRFTFNESRRKHFRESLGLPAAAMLIGHVGRFELMKNHAFLVDVFKELAEENSNIYLLLAGDGSLRANIEQKAHKLGLDNRILFLGLIEDMPSFYDSLDCFVMPSLFEGLPFSAIEAQCSGLPCVLSNRITDEVAITDLVSYLPLETNANAWADYIFGTLYNSDSASKRSCYAEQVAKAGYDIREVANELTRLYLGK